MEEPLKSRIQPKLYFMMDTDSQYQSNPAMVEVLEGLRLRGFHVDVGVAEELVTQPDLLNIEYDLYVVKSNTELSLSLAGVLHAQGARMVNPYWSCVTVKDKIVTSRLLRASGIPVPSSWVTGRLDLMWGVVKRTPLVIKPYRGHRGNGVRLVQTVDELSAIPQPRSPVLIQEFVAGTGDDLKVYVVGKEVFGVRKQSVGLSSEPQSEQPSKEGLPCEVSNEVRDIAVRCGEALGLGLYGLDVLETERGPKVVDLNSFPSYRGAVDAAPLITDYISACASGEIDF
jgi:ribosomal protein S6--L-glutamate ligase